MRKTKQTAIALAAGLFALAAPALASNRELAEEILADKEMDFVLERGRALFKSGFSAGDGYAEVWIRDFNTFVEIALEVRGPKEIRDALVTFFHFQEKDGNIIDGYVPKSKAGVGYKYRKSATRPNLLGHKNTVETDQETSLVQAVCKYIKETDDKAFLKQEINGQTIERRLERTMEFLLEKRHNEKYGLLWGATTVDWGDVQPEHEWGVVLDDQSHPAIDIYDNAMFVTAIRLYLEVIAPDHPARAKWKAVADRIGRNAMRHLWDAKRQKFLPHLYLDKGSPFPADFDEAPIYYHGGTTAAMQADLLSPEQIRRALADMVKNVKIAPAASVGLTNWPPYPKGYFKNPSMKPLSYQNAGDWTWWGGRTIQELTRNGLVEEAYRELRPMILRVKKNNGFYEWYTIKNEPRGSGSFRGSAGVLGKAIYMLRDWAKQQQKSAPEKP